ncbi:hypothetical protein K7711_06100 [Nocardia sp. CA2R105]|uniref:hypothetical protein n=1 Tax=Nocardia coffeae TaxID=2873381 RepID=UPI001CA6A776|nr:hypothetical protein [Nocardia coffeae]MBY8856043.1 hypothetical protein [Nocardia coffeae]
MANNPTPSEAARALRDVTERTNQAVDSTQRARWVDIVLGVAIFVMLAAPDFLGKHAAAVSTLIIVVITVGYSWLGRTRRGAAVFGQPARVRRQAISRRFSIPAVTLLLGVMALGIALPLLGLHPLAGVPYWRTILGAVLGLTLIVFGRRLQNTLNALAHNGHRPESDTLDGHH